MKAPLSVAALIVPTSIAFLAGSWHAWHRMYLVDVVRRQSVVPVRLAPLAAAGVIVAEIVVGLGGLLVALIAEQALRPVAAAMACLFGSYTVYTSLLLRKRVSVPCGCGGAEIPVTGWVVGRAAILAGISLSLLLPGVDLELRAVTDALAAALAAPALTLLAWYLPEAMRERPFSPDFAP